MDRPCRRTAGYPFSRGDTGKRALHLGESYRPLKSADATQRHRDSAAASARGGEQRLADLIAPLCGHGSTVVAADLVSRFGSLSALFRANRAALESRLPGRRDLIDMLLAVQPLVRELLKAEMLDAPVLPDNRAAIRYLHASMAHEPAEQVRVLYLDAKNRILRDDVAARGSVTKTDIFPREIVRRALDLGATGLIMAHNHPSGDPEPSRHDLTATRAVAEAARLFDIVLHDHIVIGRGGYRSLREEGYL
ncbi:JAB domain-containing protein [Rhizorhabdus dicambivorans]|nr:DNA repair protein RadC [Rhizorhabdus dicambivorans]